MAKLLIAEFSVAGTPVPKERPRLSNGHTYTPARTLAAEEVVAWQYRAARKNPIWTLERLLAGKDRLAIEIDAYLPDRRSRDWDNIGKLVSDALNMVAYRDDSQIKDAHVLLLEDVANPRTEVRLYLME